jgi:hypothetical protein
VGTVAAIGSRPRRQSRPGAQSWSFVASFTLAHTTRRPSPSRTPSHIGVFPFLGSPPREEERRGSGGEEEEERGRGGRTRDAASAPRPEAVRVSGEPYQSPREREEPSALEGKLEQSTNQGAAGNTYTAPPSTSGHRRLHLRPAVSVVAFLASRSFSP